jgi:hypothetical protein
VTLGRPVIFHCTAECAALNEIAQQTVAGLRGGVLRGAAALDPLARAAEAQREPRRAADERAAPKLGGGSATLPKLVQLGFACRERTVVAY